MASSLDLVSNSQAFSDRAAENIISVDHGIVGTLLTILLPPLAPIVLSLLDSLLTPLAHLVGGVLGIFSQIPISKTFESFIPTDILKDLYVAGTAGFFGPIFLLGAINPLLGIILGVPLGVIIYIVLVIPLVILFGGLSDLGRFLLALPVI